MVRWIDGAYLSALKFPQRGSSQLFPVLYNNKMNVQYTSWVNGRKLVHIYILATVLKFS
jgi:hypothetical protein